MQLYLQLPSESRMVVEELGRSLERVRVWMWVNKLKLNPDQVEVLVVGLCFGLGSGCTLLLDGAVLIQEDQVDR